MNDQFSYHQTTPKKFIMPYKGYQNTVPTKTLYHQDVTPSRIRSKQPFTSSKSGRINKSFNLQDDPTNLQSIESINEKMHNLEFELFQIKQKLREEENQHVNLQRQLQIKNDSENKQEQQIQQLIEANAILEQKLKHMKKSYYQHKPVSQDIDFQKNIEFLKAQLVNLSNQLEEQKKHQKIKDQQKQFSSQRMQKLEEEIGHLKMQQQEREKEYGKKLQQLQKENESLRSQELSFQQQKKYFENELKQLQEYFQELISTNENLTKENQLLRESDSKSSQQEQQFQGYQRTQPNYTEQDIEEMVRKYVYENDEDLVRLSFASEDYQRIFVQFKSLLTSQPIFHLKTEGLSKVQSAEFRQQPMKLEEMIDELQRLQNKSNSVVNEIEKKKDQMENTSDTKESQGLLKELEELDQEYEELQVQIESLSGKINFYLQKDQAEVATGFDIIQDL